MQHESGIAMEIYVALKNMQKFLYFENSITTVMIFRKILGFKAAIKVRTYLFISQQLSNTYLKMFQNIY